MLKTKIPPPVYMLLFGIAMYFLAKAFPSPVLLEPVERSIGYAFAALALLLDFSAILQFFKSKTTVNPIKPQNTRTIVNKGMYRFSRNPMYLGLFFWLVAWAIYLAVPAPFLLLPVFIWLITVMQIIPEEKVLEEKFGDDYLNYKKQVRRWI